MPQTQAAMNNERVLNDRMVKLVCIPALGLFIPNLSGLITNRLYSYPELFASYIYFIFVSFLVWQGNVWLMMLIRRQYSWSFKEYYKIILAFFLANIVYSGILSGMLLYIWKTLSLEPYNISGPLVNSTLIIIIAACFITNLYEILFLNQER